MRTQRLVPMGPPGTHRGEAFKLHSLAFVHPRRPAPLVTRSHARSVPGLAPPVMLWGPGRAALGTLQPRTRLGRPERAAMG